MIAEDGVELIGSFRQVLAHVETLCKRNGFIGGGGRVQYLLQQSILIQSPAVVHAQPVVVMPLHGGRQNNALEVG